MIINLKQPYLTGHLLLSASLLYGCAGSTSSVRVSRSGGIALDSSMVLAIGNISGDQENEFRKELSKALTGNSDFKMLKEEPGQEIMTDSLSATIAPAL